MFLLFHMTGIPLGAGLEGPVVYPVVSMLVSAGPSLHIAPGLVSAVQGPGGPTLALARGAHVTVALTR